MNTFSRAWRHLTSTRTRGRKSFPRATLEAIKQVIATGESLHRAEIRVVIEPSLDLYAILEGVSARARAHELFSQYRIWDTEENSGILVYIDLADHQVEIIADRGVARLLSSHDWFAVCGTMTENFARGAYHEGVITGLQLLNDKLQMCFPEVAAQRNQLSNTPILL